jgi:hypothetical protein
MPLSTALLVTYKREHGIETLKGTFFMGPRDKFGAGDTRKSTTFRWVKKIPVSQVTVE